MFFDCLCVRAEICQERYRNIHGDTYCQYQVVGVRRIFWFFQRLKLSLSKKVVVTLQQMDDQGWPANDEILSFVQLWIFVAQFVELIVAQEKYDWVYHKKTLVQPWNIILPIPQTFHYIKLILTHLSHLLQLLPYPLVKIVFPHHYKHQNKVNQQKSINYQVSLSESGLYYN